MSEPIKTYSLEEVAAMVLPPDWKGPVRWLKRRLAAGEVGGYKLSRGAWRMTHADVEELIDLHHNSHRTGAPPVGVQPIDLHADQVDVLAGLSPRSRARRINRPGEPGP